ncbi:glycoside hydrolase family protein [Pontiella sulfatireligans]|uniref:Uncharacterized protein n=1 Tax=Pontiella sulfatireligans TaxID=2750658 RepID=A0A6C2UEN4_9BACT|nr:glycoside hydrolase family protein [Pontiella sulfatireligans]VGO18333.1 hypothetical protein SCARR_00385 [Pontiella sulfatireligans]
MNKMKNLGLILSIGILSDLSVAHAAKQVAVSSFCKAQVPGKYILPSEEGEWTWGMAPIYDEEGKLHVFNSIIPTKGSWKEDSRIVHWTADAPEGPYTFLGDVFVSDEAGYHNPQVSKVGDTYVLVYLFNKLNDENGSMQEIGIATAKSLDGPWKESPLNPIIPASGKMGGAEINHASNPTFVAAPDGEFRIYYKSMTDKHTFREISLAVSDNIEGPYVNYAGNPVISYADQQLDIEDPYAFHYNGMYYMIVEDRRGVKDMLEGNPLPVNHRQSGGLRPGLIYTSKDGIEWGIPEVGYLTNELYFGDKLARSERPSILWKDGQPESLFLACHDKDSTAGYFVEINNWNGQ